MADLLQDYLALGKRLDKHGTWLYNLEKLDIPHKVSQSVDEIVTDAVDWAMKALLRARFRDLPTYEAMQKSLELDYSNQRLAEREEARKKRRKRLDAPRSPPGSPPSQPPPPPPPAGASGAPSTTGASGSSQLPPPPPPLSTSTSGSTPQQGRGVSRAQELSPSDDLMHDDSAPDEQAHVSNETPRMITHQQLLPQEKTDVENNWASALASRYEPPAENSLLVKTGHMTTFLNWYCYIIHLQFQMEECHKMLTDQVDWANLEGDQVRINVNRPLPLGGPQGHMKATRYPDFSLKLLVPEHMWIEDVCTYDISVKYGIAHWRFN
ncbi:hypothetical protein Tco_1097393 [Tanacetum coccineum]